MTTAKKGNQTPTKSFIIDYNNSKYLEAKELYEKTEKTCYEWQENLLKPIMAVEEDGLWTHQKFGYSVPRRNGKTEIVYMVELWALHQGFNILHTAHRISTSHSSFEKLKKLLESSGYSEGDDFNSIRAKGQERLELYSTGGVIQFRTRTANGGLGEGFDLLVIDEAQEYTTEQESALKYTVTDSNNPMTLMCGTPPTPASSGTVFTNFRDKTLENQSKYSGWAEWSVDDEKDINDIESWYLTNPSMGFHLNERKIEAELGTDFIDHNIQRLGYWLKYNQKSAISEKEWIALKVLNLPVFVGQLFVGIKYGNNGVNVALSIAVKTLSGRIFIESIDCQSIKVGTHWIINFLKKANVSQVVIDGQSGQNILAKDMKEFKIKPPILPTVKEIIEANSSFEQGIYQKNICHNNQPSLCQVITNSNKRNIGSNGGFGYKAQFDDMDIALMDSAILAYWACLNVKEKRIQQVRY